MLENQEYYNMFLTEDDLINESKMSAEERKKLHPETFGAKYDGEEKYPLNDEEHVRSAISYFHKAPEAKRKSLAKKIVKAAKKFGIEISEKSKVMKALKENVDKILLKTILDANSNRDNVILDMTNLSVKVRRRNLSYFSDDYTKIAIAFPVLSKDEYDVRNNFRRVNENKYIPNGVLSTMIKSYVIPTYDEGFDVIVKL